MGLVGLFIYEYFRIKPNDVRFSNVTSSSVTVSWNTDREISASVMVYEGDRLVPVSLFDRGNRFFDTRDVKRAELLAVQETVDNIVEGDDLTISSKDFEVDIEVTDMGEYYTHHVTVTNLEPETEYSFMIGDRYVYREVKSENGNVTATTLEVPENVRSPLPAYGSVKDAENKEDTSIDELKSIGDAIIYLTLLDRESEEESNIFSSSFNSSGNWYMDIASARDEEGEFFIDKYFDLRVGLLIDAGPKGKWRKVVDFDTISPTNMIVINDPLMMDDSELGVERVDAGLVNSTNIVKGVEASGCMFAGWCGPCCKIGTVGGTCDSCSCDSSVLESRNCKGESTLNLQKVLQENAKSVTVEESTSSQNKPTSISQINEAKVGSTCYDRDGNRGEVIQIDQYEKKCRVFPSKVSEINKAEIGSTCYVNGKKGTIVKVDQYENRCKVTSSSSSKDTEVEEKSGTDIEGDSSYVGYIMSGDSCKGLTAKQKEAIEKNGMYGAITIFDSKVLCKDYRDGAAEDSNDGAAENSNDQQPTTERVCWEEGWLTNLVVITSKGDQYQCYKGVLQESDGTKSAEGALKQCLDFKEDGEQKCTWVGAYCHLEDEEGSKLYKCLLRNKWVDVQDIDKEVKAGVGEKEAEKEVYIPGGSKCNNSAGCTCGTLLLWDNSISETEYCPDYTAEQCQSLGEHSSSEGRICSTNSEKHVCKGGECVPEEEIKGIQDSIINQKEKLIEKLVSSLKASSSQYVLDPKTGIFSELLEGSYIFNYNGDMYSFNVNPEDEDIMVYIDSNDNDKYDEGIDIKISDIGSQINIIALEQKHYYSLTEGLNFISLPFLISGEEYRTAAGLLTKLNEVYNDAFYSIAKFDGRWKIVGQNVEIYDNEDFQLLPGEGYMIKSKRDIDISIVGQPVQFESESDQAPINFSEGWNLIGLYGTNVKQYTAKSLIQDVNADDFTADNVTKWAKDKQMYEGFQMTDGEEYGFDYPLNKLESYFVRITEGKGNWQPSLGGNN